MAGVVFVVVLLVLIAGVFAMGAWYHHNERQKMDAMAPEEREAYVAAKRERAEAARQRRVEYKAQQAAARVARKPQPISQVGRKGDGGVGLGCPKCGGTQFKARRSTKARAGIVASGVVTMGVAAPLVGVAATKKTQVACLTCGTRYLRG